MPKGYPDTKTCPNCKEGNPAEYSFCPWCGADMNKKSKKSKLVEVQYKPPEFKALSSVPETTIPTT